MLDYQVVVPPTYMLGYYTEYYDPTEAQIPITINCITFYNCRTSINRRRLDRKRAGQLNRQITEITHLKLTIGLLEPT